jgi:hypothetical protein
MPLNSDRHLVEQCLGKFISFLKLHNPAQYLEQTKNFDQLEGKPEFVALFLKQLPFLNRVKDVPNP